jgi:hypothetical protein
MSADLLTARVNFQSLSNAKTPTAGKFSTLDNDYKEEGRTMQYSHNTQTAEVFVRAEQSLYHINLDIWISNPFKILQCFERRQR